MILAWTIILSCIYTKGESTDWLLVSINTSAPGLEQSMMGQHVAMVLGCHSVQHVSGSAGHKWGVHAFDTVQQCEEPLHGPSRVAVHQQGQALHLGLKQLETEGWGQVKVIWQLGIPVQTKKRTSRIRCALLEVCIIAQHPSSLFLWGFPPPFSTVYLPVCIPTCPPTSQSLPPTLFVSIL